VVFGRRQLLHALQVDVNRRFSGGLTLRGVYTLSKVLDDGDSLNADDIGRRTGASFESVQPAVGLGLRDVRRQHVAVANATYALALGHGNRFLLFGGIRERGGERLDGELHRDVAGRLPVFAAAQLQPVEQWDTRNPVRPFANPASPAGDSWQAEPVV